MATEQRIGLSARAAFRNFIRLIPAVVIIAVTLNTFSCNSSGFLQSAGDSNSPTATPTSGTGQLAFVTNFNDGKVSSFTRNTTTGVLKRSGEVTAGKKKGPKGLVATPNGSFVYVANSSDGNIYQFSANQTNAVLTPLGTPSISNGASSGPDQIAVNPAGSFLFVTGFNDGTITTYAIDSGTGQLTKKTQVGGLSHPFGISVDSAGAIAYVADNGAGLVYAFAINGTTGALDQIGLPVFDLGSPGGTPGYIVIDPANTYIYVTDLNAGVLSIIQTTSGTLAFGSTQPLSTTGNVPLGVGYASVTSVGNFLFTANQGNSSLWSFLLTVPGFPSPPVEFGTASLNAPTGLVVDPQMAFLYITNQNAGTVSQFSLSSTCFASSATPCFVGSVATESPANGNSGPFGIVLAQ